MITHMLMSSLKTQSTENSERQKLVFKKKL